ncbi:MAG: DUF2073 domain-containing protein [Candidatus Altiarchaeales archaeon]|nr:DUF2073 domain-containing protein [Candidatus Altiarchaeales archaeon]MBD3416487.1 DUF2073 domain-containing protein [Candidatus Altiarchaeales archaeon]
MSVKLEFVSANVLAGMSRGEKMSYILDHVKEDKILVIEEGMSAVEEGELITATMELVDKKFSGIEVSTLREKSEEGIREKLIRMLGGRTGGLTVIGPSKLVRQIKKDPRHISLLAGEDEEREKSSKRKK